MSAQAFAVTNQQATVDTFQHITEKVRQAGCPACGSHVLLVRQDQSMTTPKLRFVRFLCTQCGKDAWLCCYNRAPTWPIFICPN